MKYIKVKRFIQPGKVECGPATVCAAVSIFPEISSNFSINSVIEASGVIDIKKGGTSIDELSIAVEKLSNGKLNLTSKTKGSIAEIKKFLEKGVPVGVDWQGSTFDGSDGGRGHYGLVVGLDEEDILIVDSLPDFSETRLVKISDFMEKWWDTDDKERYDRLMFVIDKC